MSWIQTIDYQSAKGPLKRLYDKISGPGNNVDNVLMIHSLRPNTLKGHMALYKGVLHSSQNTLPKWYLETIGVYVSMMNQCDYCVQHHQAGLKKLLDDDKTFKSIIRSLSEEHFDTSFDAKLKQGLLYARMITNAPNSVREKDIQSLRALGLTDGEILEINQVASYFNYVNRMVLCLGVNTNGDILGLSPNDNSDPDNWSHT